MGSSRVLRRSLAAVALSIWGTACTSVQIIPEPSGATRPLLLRGEIEFEGDPDYLPTTLRHEVQQALGLHYEYEVDTRDHDYEPVLVLFNPLTLLGFPAGRTEMTVVGTLDVSAEGRKVAVYQARYHFTKTRSVYSSRDLSTPRRQGLLAVRDCIDDQLRGDADRLLGFVNVGQGPPQGGMEP